MQRPPPTTARVALTTLYKKYNKCMNKKKFPCLIEVKYALSVSC